MLEDPSHHMGLAAGVTGGPAGGAGPAGNTGWTGTGVSGNTGTACNLRHHSGGALSGAGSDAKK